MLYERNLHCPAFLHRKAIQCLFGCGCLFRLIVPHQRRFGFVRTQHRRQLRPLESGISNGKWLSLVLVESEGNISLLLEQHTKDVVRHLVR